MKIKFFSKWVMCAVLVSVLAAIAGYSQEDIETVEDSAFTHRMRRLVPFLHDEHNETAEIEDCTTCHHVYQNGQLVEDESSEGMECSECHLNPDDDHFISLINAYHKNCKGCHLEKKTGPVMCSECHIK